MRKSIYFFVIALAALLAGCNNDPTPEDRFSKYVELWNEQKFEDMYDYLTADAKEAVTKKEYVERYQKVYTDLEISDLKIKFDPPEEKAEGEETKFSFSAKMNSLAGPISFKHQAPLKQETQNEKENWFVDWDTTFIFPELGAGDKIGLSSVPSVRGEIVDRNDNGLAVNGTALEIGIVPAQMEGNREDIISRVAGLLGIEAAQIDKALNAEWVQPDYFVPIKKIPVENQELLAQLMEIPSVLKKDVPACVYPYKDAAAQLVGYVGPVTAEELKELASKGYSSNDVIGKRGMEQVLEERLKGQNGSKIYIKKEDGSEVLLAEKEVANGENVKLTIDIGLQSTMFNELAGEAGTGTAMNPVTGETLALVSSPAFDPNTISLGATGQYWKSIEENPQKPLTTRFKQTYAPGSVIKPITAAIGLKEGAITPEQQMEVDGLQWQKDNSWGSYKITRVTDPNGPVNLDRALLLSDNIYFAQAALALGAEKLTAGLNSFGFEEEFGYAFPLENSKIGELDNEVRLADSGYGQGHIEMNIVHLASSYTPFVNNGTMIRPILLADEQTAQPLKENLVDESVLAQINNSLRKVVEDPSGTAHSARIDGYPLAGKTGTAELKEKQGEKGTENGWFVAYNVENPNLLIAMMVEGVENKGGSKPVVSRVKNVFQSSRQ
ncbi:penicillin-binding transpeptidase domain-containing protein [Bacillus canaveralius]|uniref:penicillin-binding transpeptidase domain-containing protein n=1 Tax=Bacillus canaveralius TaxID=1403243 RepID=UPI000F7928FF|nr:penicillin-binding transpeptidase domain-containing protein [Bacillus canaveralius]RSK54204.1 penicillin-binding transpeptidase domain-containing protein [Bacillus canaveralius]